MQSFIPALRFEILTPFYDQVVGLAARETVFKKALLAGAGIEAGHDVLDLGCGTGTLAILAKELVPRAEIVGLDADTKILEIARRKAGRKQVRVRFDEGRSDRLPYPDKAFDRVVSSLFVHHLTRAGKLAALGEVRRVLRRDGELHIADWGQPSNPLMGFLSHAVKLLDGHETTSDSFNGIVPRLLDDAGFLRVKEDSKAFDTLFGTIRIHRSISK